jgi:hypothetical protein
MLLTPITFSFSLTVGTGSISSNKNNYSSKFVSQYHGDGYTCLVPDPFEISPHFIQLNKLNVFWKKVLKEDFYP